MSNEQIFSAIIEKKRWKNHICGTGSTLPNTQNIRERLPAILQDLNCNSLLDAPCGDYSWMSTIQWPNNFQYIGADILTTLIDQAKKQWPDVDFRHLDIITDPLPQVDIMLCRDCFIHFPWEQIRRTLQNIVDADIKYLATTSYEVGEQFDIKMGECHHINLCDSPANFPEPICKIPDQGHPILQHHIMVWSKAQITQVLANWK